MIAVKMVFVRFLWGGAKNNLIWEAAA